MFGEVAELYDRHRPALSGSRRWTTSWSSPAWRSVRSCSRSARGRARRRRCSRRAGCACSAVEPSAEMAAVARRVCAGDGDAGDGSDRGERLRALGSGREAVPAGVRGPGVALGGAGRGLREGGLGAAGPAACWRRSGTVRYGPGRRCARRCSTPTSVPRRSSSTRPTRCIRRIRRRATRRSGAPGSRAATVSGAVEVRDYEWSETYSGRRLRGVAPDAFDGPGARSRRGEAGSCGAVASGDREPGRPARATDRHAGLSP